MESLACAGSFDCFPQLHRAQYFTVAEGEDVTGLEKIIRYGQVMGQQQTSAAHTLFGELPISMEIPPPRMLEVSPWPLLVQLEKEKEVTGIYLSGHPLDNYKFEIRHYGITAIQDFNEFRDTIRQQNNPGRPFRIVGLVADAQHRIAKSGNKYGNFIIEDYSGKMEFPLFSDDYLKLSPLLQPGSTVLINGFLKQRYNRDEFEFKLMGVTLAETMIANLTRSILIETEPTKLTDEMIQFFEKNFKRNPGKTAFKFTLIDDRNKLVTNLISSSQGIEMNPDLVKYLEDNPNLRVAVQTA